MDFKDYYATLGVAKSASEKEIKQAFRRLARKLHPDVNPGDKAAEARFKDINEAYEVLGNPETRKKYDELGSNWKLYEQAQARGGPNPFAGGRGGGSGGGFRTMTPEEMEEMFGGGGESHPFSDFFTTFFGGGGGATSERPRRRAGRDVEHEIELTLEDASSGVTRRLEFQRGSGPSRSVDVRIPPGVAEGSRVRVGGEGEPGRNGGPAGDLFLRVRLAPHPVFERKGQDLYVNVPVPVTTAVLGGQVNVPTLAGTPARLKVPPLTQNGQVFRLRGYGMPSVGSTEKGNLFARVDAQLPRALSPQAREHYTALAQLGDSQEATETTVKTG
jgi:DnaJ-class molecular chaperone